MRKIVTVLLFTIVVLSASNRTACRTKHDESLAKFADDMKYSFLEDDRSKLGYSVEDQQKIYFIAFSLGVDEQWLYDIFYLECKHDHHDPNLFSGAVGLIQFTPRTAKYLGTNSFELLNMSKFEQLEYVYTYLKKLKPADGYKTFTDLYLTVFWPKAVGMSEHYRIGGRRTCLMNPGVDRKGNNDGRITISDVNSWINYHL